MGSQFWEIGSMNLWGFLGCRGWGRNFKENWVDEFVGFLRCRGWGRDFLKLAQEICGGFFAVAVGVSILEIGSINLWWFLRCRGWG